MEQHYAFLKNNRVQQVAVFASQDEDLADAIAKEQGFDDAVWVGENKPAMWSSYDGKVFTDPDENYLFEIGILNSKPLSDAVKEQKRLEAKANQVNADLS